jgi:hypothetical protein
MMAALRATAATALPQHRQARVVADSCCGCAPASAVGARPGTPALGEGWRPELRGLLLAAAVATSSRNVVLYRGATMVARLLSRTAAAGAAAVLRATLGQGRVFYWWPHRLSPGGASC